MSRTILSRTTLSRSVLTVSALAAALACAGASTVSASAESNQGSPAHKMTFTAKHTGIVPTSRRNYVLTDDIVQDGQQVGADVLSCRTQGELAHCVVTLGLGDGQMHLRITLNEDGDLHGKVLGGTGSYAGAAGRVRGHAASENAERVVVRWRA